MRQTRLLLVHCRWQAMRFALTPNPMCRSLPTEVATTFDLRLGKSARSPERIGNPNRFNAEGFLILNLVLWT